MKVKAAFGEAYNSVSVCLKSVDYTGTLVQIPIKANFCQVFLNDKRYIQWNATFGEAECLFAPLLFIYLFLAFFLSQALTT